MRKSVLAIAAATALCFPVSAFSQGIQIGPGGIYVGDDHRDHEGSQRRECEEMRTACLK